jgi:uncharacterized membrane protein YfcA
LTKTWTERGAGYFFSAIIGLLVGLYLIITLPQAWMYGAFILVVSLILLMIALRGRQRVEREKEKPLMDVTT